MLGTKRNEFCSYWSWCSVLFRPLLRNQKIGCHRFSKGLGKAGNSKELKKNNQLKRIKGGRETKEVKREKEPRVLLCRKPPGNDRIPSLEWQFYHATPFLSLFLLRTLLSSSFRYLFPLAKGKNKVKTYSPKSVSNHKHKEQFMNFIIEVQCITWHLC